MVLGDLLELGVGQLRDMTILLEIRTGSFDLFRAWNAPGGPGEITDS